MSFSDERRHLREQSGHGPRMLDRFSERAANVDTTRREAAVKYLRRHRGKAFRARSNQVALEAGGMACWSFFSVSVALDRLKQEDRVRQTGHGIRNVP